MNSNNNQTAASQIAPEQIDTKTLTIDGDDAGEVVSHEQDRGLQAWRFVLVDGREIIIRFDEIRNFSSEDGLSVDTWRPLVEQHNLVAQIRTAVQASSARSAWQRGVKAYADDLLDGLLEAINYGSFDMADWSKPRALRTALLNGAYDWKEYSCGGCSLCYNGQIAKRLCTPSELKRYYAGKLDRPNSREEWLDCQARALFQAANLIYRNGCEIIEKEA
jgi:hypothetical protein